MSEASPILGCSIEISCDICRYVGLSTKNAYAKMHGRNYMAQTRACSKSDFGQFKLTCDTWSIHFGYMLEPL